MDLPLRSRGLRTLQSQRILYALSFIVGAISLVALILSITGYKPSNARISGVFDYSDALVKSAPEYIIVGKLTNDTFDFPMGSLSSNKKRSSVDLLPVFPSLLDIPQPFPPNGAVEVETIEDAMKLLQNKVVTNTTILLRRGTYETNFVIDGFDTNCGTIGSNDVNDSLSILSCRGLTVIGDNRRIAGTTWTKGGFRDGSILEIGASTFVNANNIICLNSTSLQILDDNVIDLIFSGVVNGDKITIFNQDTQEYFIKTVVSVDTNIFYFQEPGCSIGSKGSSVTLMPNRVIQGQARSANIPQDSPGLGLEDVALRTSSALTVLRDVLIYGLWVRDPEEKFNHTRMLSVCNFGKSSVFIHGIVCDGRRNTIYRQNVFPSQAEGHTVTFFGTKSFFSNRLVSRANTGQTWYVEPNVNLIRADYSSMTVFGPGDNRVICSFNGNDVGFYIHRLNIINGGAFFGLQTDVSTQNLQISAPNSTNAVFINSGKVRTNLFYVFGGIESGVRVAFGGELYTRFYSYIQTNLGASRCIDGRYDGNILEYADQASIVGFSFQNCTTQIDVKNGGRFYTDKFQYIFIDYDASSEVTIGGNLLGSYQPVRVDSDFNAMETLNLFDFSLTYNILLTIQQQEQMFKKEHTVVSRFPNQHTIRLSGLATWDGTNRLVTFPAAERSVLKFVVLPGFYFVITSNAENFTFSP